MPVTELRVSGYRSIRELTVPLKRVNVLVGANGCGKSNLYQSMALLWSAANGQLGAGLAREGGMSSALWAGPTKQTAHIAIGASLDEFEYDLRLGLAEGMPGSMFGQDPSVKLERLAYREGKKSVVLMERGVGTCYIRDREGSRTPYILSLRQEESVLHQVSDPFQYPHLTALRNKILRWRFYHQFRTDTDSPLRHSQVPVRTFIMAHDGRDLASALATIVENGDDRALRNSIASAFEGARIEFRRNGDGIEIALNYRGLQRCLSARELSDGTLRYLCLLAALLSPTPPPLIALNEPESSLHPQLLTPLAKLIAEASTHSQIWLTTHSGSLAEAIAEQSGVKPIELVKVDGETMRAGRTDRRVYFQAEESD
jgi:predicted ATPase